MSDKLNLLGTLATNFKGKGSVAFVNCGYVYFFFIPVLVAISIYNYNIRLCLCKGCEKDEPTSRARMTFMSYRWSFEVDGNIFENPVSQKTATVCFKNRLNSNRRH